MTPAPSPLPAALLLGAAVLLIRPPRRPVARLTARPGSAPVAGRLRSSVPPAAWIAAVGVAGLIGWPLGLVAGATTLAGVRLVLARTDPAGARRRRARIAADLPLAVDLVAGTLRSGRPVDEALSIAGSAIGGPLGASLDGVRHRLRLGMEPAEAWRRLADEPACASLARSIHRALASGAGLAQTLEQLAADARRDRRWTADERARAVETQSVAPLGLCFLPAFVLLGVVPAVAGALRGVLSVVGG